MDGPICLGFCGVFNPPEQVSVQPRSRFSGTCFGIGAVKMHVAFLGSSETSRADPNISSTFILPCLLRWRWDLLCNKQSKRDRQGLRQSASRIGIWDFFYTLVQFCNQCILNSKGYKYSGTLLLRFLKLHWAVKDMAKQGKEKRKLSR